MSKRCAVNKCCSSYHLLDSVTSRDFVINQFIDIFTVFVASICRSDDEFKYWGIPISSRIIDRFGNGSATSSSVDFNTLSSLVGGGGMLHLDTCEYESISPNSLCAHYNCDSVFSRNDAVLIVNVQEFIRLKKQLIRSNTFLNSSHMDMASENKHLSFVLNHLLDGIVRVCSNEGRYDARARVVLKKLISIFGLSCNINAIEQRYLSQTKQLIFPDVSCPLIISENDTVSLPCTNPMKYRWFQVGVAAVGGGLAVTLSSQMAFASSVSSLMSIATHMAQSTIATSSKTGSLSAGIGAAATVASNLCKTILDSVIQLSDSGLSLSHLFGSTAAVVSAVKMVKSTAPLSYFSFERLLNSSHDEYIDIGAEPMHCVGDSCIPHLSIIVAGHVDDGISDAQVWSFEKPRESIEVQTASAELDMWHKHLEVGPAYLLRWTDTKDLEPFTKSYENMLWQQILETAVGLTRNVILTNLFSLSMELPVDVMRMINGFDNPWSVSINRSRQAGEYLARLLLEKRAQGIDYDAPSIHQRSNGAISLMGYGMGAAVIHFCLKTLVSEGGYAAQGIIENVILIGAPVECSQSLSSDWQRSRDVVAGRLVNCYSTRDYMLAIMARVKMHTLMVAGLQPVVLQGSNTEGVGKNVSVCEGEMEGYVHIRRESSGVEESVALSSIIENVDVSHLISSQADYPKYINEIMEIVSKRGCTLHRVSA